MLSFANKITFKLQCYFCIAIIAFATLGCSVKQTMFEAMNVSIEKPLSGSKVLVGNSFVFCDAEVTAKSSLKQIKTEQQRILPFVSFDLVTKDFSSQSRHLKVVSYEELRISGNSPPLYVLFKRMKIALLA
ncbi:hypothetical protein [Myroides pelagicus]|uniref:Lipoprotein n=1 Tax=Myroides pelagicus TaxID=270914 RepID=A0A7K1GMW4_9FLAO|nr:hypothetical protein [Myroides pelagicus]MEC4112569.1 hypothetical protein [Myroides pelagicus]MTH29554.1 hypothetical protein [Myroides pelagicus]